MSHIDGRRARQAHSEPLKDTYSANPGRHVVSGQWLARAHLSRRQRAEIAAGLADGSLVISPPTVRQSAALAQVPVVEVTKARRENGNGHANSNGKPDGETLAQHIARSSPAERVEAARAVGVDELWDTMVDPIVATGRAVTE